MKKMVSGGNTTFPKNDSVTVVKVNAVNVDFGKNDQ